MSIFDLVHLGPRQAIVYPRRGGDYYKDIQYTAIAGYVGSVPEDQTRRWEAEWFYTDAKINSSRFASTPRISASINPTLTSHILSSGEDIQAPISKHLLRKSPGEWVAATAARTVHTPRYRLFKIGDKTVQMIATMAANMSFCMFYYGPAESRVLLYEDVLHPY
ncbi:hypothetical protein BD779DRAFT_1772043 [Infundibulicybe gibba]|nr:hypothetical protein BD779DRAFT_1772043 [Infundibulicybe gibba]